MFVEGDELAGYRIEALIGRGGMSEVYRAENPRLGNKVALKLLAPELADDDRFRERFIRESRTAAALEHPNVLPIYDAGSVDGVAYIAMRYVDGPDLRTVIDEGGPLPVERVLSIVKQIGGALDAAHERGLIHRDVKPGNIVIDEHVDGEPGGHAYLTDFGVAKHSLSQSGLTSTGQFVGTIDYIAPEQIEGKQVDRRTDVYSLACVLFECLAGAPPFTRESNVAMIYAHLLDPPPALTAQRPDLPPEVDAVLERGLAKSRDERYETCRALVADFRTAVSPEGETVTFSTPSNGSSTALAAPVLAQTPATATKLASEPPAALVAATVPAATAPAPTAASPPAAPPPLRADGTASAPPASFETAPTVHGRGGRSSRAVLLGVGVAVLALAGAAVAALMLTGGSSSALAAPSSLRASATGRSNVRLTWVAPAKGNADGYHVIRNGTRIASVHGTRYADGPLSASSAFVYTVRAFRGSDEGPASNRVTARITGETIVTTGDGKTITTQRPVRVKPVVTGPKPPPPPPGQTSPPTRPTSPPAPPAPTRPPQDSGPPTRPPPPVGPPTRPPPPPEPGPPARP